MTFPQAADLLKRLPSVRGRYMPNEPLGKQVWFRVGGAAEVLYKPADVDDLCFFMRHCPHDIPKTILGVGSNVLIRDGGIPGVVIKLARGFQSISFQGTMVTCGAAALDRTVALEAAARGIGGLSFLVGIPGTIGGAIYMNAGAYGAEVKDILKHIRVVTKEGDLRVLEPQGIAFTYRSSQLPAGSIVVEATFEGVSRDVEVVQQEIKTILVQREETQPTRARTGGSTFKNPATSSAWKLIDQAGCRGLTIGGAQVSEKHCNFLINTGQATAHDLETLGERVRHAVKATSNIDLQWEIKRLGEERQNGN